MDNVKGVNEGLAPETSLVKTHPGCGVATNSHSEMSINGLLPGSKHKVSRLTYQGIVSMTFRRTVASIYPKEHSMVQRILVGVDGKGGWLSPLDIRLGVAGCRWVNIPRIQFKQFRQGVCVQPDKSDEIDAHLVVELLRRLSRNRAQVCASSDEYYRVLQGLSRSHEALVRSKVGLEQQLVGLVREYWSELVTKGCFFTTTDSLAMLVLRVLLVLRAKSSGTPSVGCNQVLHNAENGVNHFLHGTHKRSSFPTAGMSFDAQAVRGAAQARQSDPVVVLEFLVGANHLSPPQDQMIAVDPDMQTRRSLVTLQ